jgi:hypothetical protein
LSLLFRPTQGWILRGVEPLVMKLSVPSPRRRALLRRRLSGRLRYTVDAGGLTAKDFELAEQCDEVFAKFVEA